MAGMKVLV
jgi:rRNA-processing protein EBP2